MTRITPVDVRKATPLLRLVNWSVRRFVGKEALPLKVIGHNPRFVLPFLGLGYLVSAKTRLDPEVRALATHLAAHINGCSWCLDFGRYAALRQGVDGEKLDAVDDYAVSPLFSPAERVALGYAEAVTHEGAPVTDDLFAELRRHFSEREIVELTVAVATENLFNRVNAALGIESQGFCAVAPPRGSAAKRAA